MLIAQTVDAIHLSPDDNVGIATRNLPAGYELVVGSYSSADRRAQ